MADFFSDRTCSSYHGIENKSNCSGIKLLETAFSNASRSIAFRSSLGGCKETSIKGDVCKETSTSFRGILTMFRLNEQ